MTQGTQQPTARVRRTFNTQGFYDGGQHIVLLPWWDNDLNEVISHEATHAKIVTNSSLGFLQQIATAVSVTARATRLPNAEQAAETILAIIHEATEEVQEASAWLVSQIVTNVNTRPPERYEALTRRLRAALEAMPERHYRCLEDCKDDHDPLFRTPVHLIQAAASYALSPPFVRGMIETPPVDIAAALRAALSQPGENPLQRFEILMRQLEATPVPAAIAWTRWVRSWYFRTSYPEPAKLAKGLLQNPLLNLGHSGFARSDISDEAVARLLLRMVDGPARDVGRIAREWEQMRRFLSFEPHVHPYFQTCVAEVPKLEKPYFYKGEEPIKDLVPLAEFVIVSVGEAEGFNYRMGEPDTVTLRFLPQPEEGALFWVTDHEKGRGFLRYWSAVGKGIATSSAGYDYGVGDTVGRPLLRDLPHAVVAISDFRTLWTRMTALSPNGLAGSSSFMIAALEAQRREFSFLILKGEKSHPLVVMPCLSDLIPMLGTIHEELRADPKFKVRFAQQEDFQELRSVGGTSLRAAIAALHDHFDPDPGTVEEARREGARPLGTGMLATLSKGFSAIFSRRRP